MTLVEYVANVSEGRRPHEVHVLAEAACTDGAHLLDTHSDPDHNRSVLTVACTSVAAAAESAQALAAACLDRIDMPSHTGVHPRLGALDVCPFIQLDPPAGVDAVDAATRVAAGISSLGIPVFLYGDVSPAAHTLPEIRRDAFAGLTPDLPPLVPHATAGASVVGVRGLLVAYNVIVRTDDRGAAAQIARALRETEGGPPGVRALALWLPGRQRMQISMNLTRPGECGIGTAWRAVMHEAGLRGVGVDGAELVGLVPRAALADADDVILSRSGIEPGNVLESALTAAGLWPDGRTIAL